MNEILQKILLIITVISFLLSGCAATLSYLGTDPTLELMNASISGNVKTVEVLLHSFDVDVNATYDKGITALMYASFCGHTEVARVLIQSGADVNAINIDGRTALIFASIEGHTDTVELLLQSGADSNTKDVNDKTAFEYARQNGHEAIVQLMKEAGTAEPQTKAESPTQQHYDDYINRGFGYVSEVNNQFIFPAVDMGKKRREGDLILGITTMEQAAKMLAAWPGYGPRPESFKEKKYPKGKISTVFQKVKYAYNPMVPGDLSLAFDKNQRLISIHVLFQGQGRSEEAGRKQQQIRDMMRQYRFEEVYHDQNESMMQGEITPCVSVNVYVPSNTEIPITIITYYFTCSTVSGDGGKCIKGDCINGHGVVSYPDGRNYEGDLINSLPSGKGTMIIPEGSLIYTGGGTYVGEFKDGLPHGIGTLSSSYLTFAGEWEDGLLNGKGTLVTPDGYSYEGDFKAGFPNGQGTMISPGGRKYVGEFKAGEQHGKGVEFLNGIESKSGYWVHDEY